MFIALEDTGEIALDHYLHGCGSTQSFLPRRGLSYRSSLLEQITDRLSSAIKGPARFLEYRAAF